MKGKKRERIIRVLLNSPDGSLSKYRISKLTGTTISWTMDFLRSLEDKGLTEGTYVKEPVKLIEEWDRISTPPKHFDFFMNDPKGFLRSVELEYALTTYFAEGYSSKVLFPSRADLFIKKEDFDAWRALILKKGLIGKGNLRLLVDDDHVFYGKRKIDGLSLVCEPQLVLDLKREGGVCMQAYEIMVMKYVR